MDSSRGFGSTRHNLFALFGLGFPPAPDVFALNPNAVPRNSPVHSTKGTPSRKSCDYPALTACRYMVSGSLSFPSRGAFHLSLTVLVHYRSSRVFSLGGWSPQLPTGFLVSRGTRARTAGRCISSLTGLSPPLAGLSRTVQVKMHFLQLPPRRATSRPVRLSTPLTQPMAGITSESVWAYLPVRSPLLGESRLMSFPPGTEMFQFPDWPLSLRRATRHDPGRVAPFGHRRLNAC